MSDYETYREELDKAQVYFENRMSDTQDKAFEYGTLVVKNTILIAGGGLLAIPAIVGLNQNIDIHIKQIVLAGFSFACALLLSILAAYIVHINWTYHTHAWQKHWEDRQELLRKIYLEEANGDDLDLEKKIILIERSQ